MAHRWKGNHLDRSCTARISYFHKYRQADPVGEMFRLSFLKPYHDDPTPRITTPRGYWRAWHQPLWLVSKPGVGGQEWMLVLTVHIKKKPHETPPVKDAIPLGGCSVSGRYWKGQWSFMDCYVSSIHVARIKEIAGPEILQHLNPRRIPAVARMYESDDPERIKPQVTEYWALLAGETGNSSDPD